MRCSPPFTVFKRTCYLVLTLIVCSAERGLAQPGASNAAIIEQGEYLARAGDCIACHTAPGGKLFAGGRPMPTPFGTLYSSNITPQSRHRHRQVVR